MDKGSVTISVPNTTTQEELSYIRQKFKQSEYYKNYKINIIICGRDNMTKNLSSVLIAKLK